MSYVGQVTIGSTTSPVGSMLYGTCSTAASTVAKVVTCSDFDKLLTGVTIHVKFTNSNTAASPTLNVNSTGAKNIYKYGSTVPGTDSNTSWVAGSVVSFTYDGSAWQMNDHIDNTTYSAMSSSELTTGTATTSRVMRADYLKTGINSLIDTKIGALDVTGASSIGAGKTISAWSETDGKVSISTQDISITKSQVSDFPGVATLTTNGLMSSDDKHIVDGLEYIVPKDWSGLTNFRGDYVWTDGDNIYYSSGSTQYVLNKSTSTWSTKTWSGLTNFKGGHIWTDGDNIYYSFGSTQYVLDKSTSTWSTKTWSGLTSFGGDSVWTDGDNIYFSYGSSSAQYVLNKSNSTWSAKTWSGLTNFYGSSIWTDGDNIYYSYGSSSTQYVLNKSNSTWSAKTWSGLTNFSGSYVWTDGDNIYYSESSTQYVLNKSTSTWSTKTWSGLTNFSGSYVWTDGDNIYYSSPSDGNYQINVPHHPISVNRRYTVSSSKWSSSANSNGYYTYTLTTFDYDFSTNNTPSICITGSSGSAIPTSTEISAFRSLLAPNGYIDQTGPHTFVLYAKTKPTSTFYIKINQISGTLSQRACKQNCKTM